MYKPSYLSFPSPLSTPPVEVSNTTSLLCFERADHETAARSSEPPVDSKCRSRFFFFILEEEGPSLSTRLSCHPTHFLCSPTLLSLTHRPTLLIRKFITEAPQHRREQRTRNYNHLKPSTNEQHQDYGLDREAHKCTTLSRSTRSSRSCPTRSSPSSHKVHKNNRHALHWSLTSACVISILKNGCYFNSAAENVSCSQTLTLFFFFYFGAQTYR
jgi:hypothetical protein